jgi:hypothetical protein
VQTRFEQGRDRYLSQRAEGGRQRAAFYTLEATSGGGLVHMKSPLTAVQAYSRTIELKRQGFTNVVAINTTTGRRITKCSVC